MADTLKTTSAEPWTGTQVSALAVVCLLVGIAGGWLVRLWPQQHLASRHPQILEWEPRCLPSNN